MGFRFNCNIFFYCWDHILVSETIFSLFDVIWKSDNIIRFVEKNSSNDFKGKKICLRDDNSHFLVSKTINPLLVSFSYRHLHSVANHLAIVYLFRITGSCLSFDAHLSFCLRIVPVFFCKFVSYQGFYFLSVLGLGSMPNLPGSLFWRVILFIEIVFWVQDTV